jgi:plasmid stabilization system protein ParE
VKPPIRLGESAAAELAEAVRWYEARRPGLGAEFRDVMGVAFDRIRRQPDAGSRVPVPSTVGLRRHLIPRFAYQVIYYLRNGEITIVAVAHTSRRPNYWRHRLPPNAT